MSNVSEWNFRWVKIASGIDRVSPVIVITINHRIDAGNFFHRAGHWYGGLCVAAADVTLGKRSRGTSVLLVRRVCDRGVTRSWRNAVQLLRIAWKVSRRSLHPTKLKQKRKEQDIANLTNIQVCMHWVIGELCMIASLWQVQCVCLAARVSGASINIPTAHA